MSFSFYKPVVAIKKFLFIYFKCRIYSFDMEKLCIDNPFVDFSDPKINNFCLQCIDGDLWFCKRILYRKSKLFKTLFDGDNDAVETPIPFTREVVSHVLKHMEDAPLKIDNHLLPKVYTVCIEWEYTMGIDYLSEYITANPTVLGVATLYQFEDSRSEDATRNLLKCSPSIIYKENDKSSVNPELMLYVIKSMVKIYQQTVVDVVEKLSARTPSRYVDSIITDIVEEYMSKKDKVARRKGLRTRKCSA